jgi:dTDP-4-dehydrorhamnose reductase
MRILVTGAHGRLGSLLVTDLRDGGHDVTPTDTDTLDLTDASGVRRIVHDTQPDLVLHCAALTAVDYCATHPDDALRINALATQSLALACQVQAAALLYVSTNEVFDGKSDRPYLEYDRPNPANPYGYSKWVGEQIVRDLVPRHTIVRTAWLFAHGGSNFVHTILGRAREGKPLRVVTNEIGSPTYAPDLSAALVRLIASGRFGIYHLVNAGAISRYGFAREILDQAGYAAVPVEPIALAEFQRPSRPPEYAPLRNFAAAEQGITLRPWQDALKAFLEREARPEK